MLDYEKIYNFSKDRTNRPDSTTDAITAKGNLGGDTEQIRGFRMLIDANFALESVTLSKKHYKLAGLEDSNAFDGIGDDLGSSEEDSGFDNEPDNNDDPFATTDDGDDPFSGGGDNPFDSNSGFGDEENDEEKKKPLTISRKEILDQKFDMSKIIRRDFPDYILRLKDVTSTAIDIVDRRQVHMDLNEAKKDIVDRYREVLKAIDAYLTIIDSEAYEDIFTTYVNFWTALNKLKIAANSLY